MNTVVYEQNISGKSFTATRAKVLIADDDEVNVAVAIGLLNKIHARVYSASGGGECLDILSRISIDIVLLDFNMGDMDGIEVLETIRKTNQNIPVIVFTANALSGAKEMYMQKGFTDYLSKPVRSSVLYDMLRRHLHGELIEIGDTSEAFDDSAQIEGLNVRDAIERTGGYENFKEAIKVFYITIEDRITKIKLYAETSDDRNYTREVHSLKSSAKLIGATRLSNLAGYMEMRGHKRGPEVFRKRTLELIDLLRHTGEIIRPHVPISTQGRKVNVCEMSTILRQLTKALGDLDVDLADSCITDLDAYRMEGRLADEYDKLKICVANINVTEALPLVTEILNLLKGGCC